MKKQMTLSLLLVASTALTASFAFAGNQHIRALVRPGITYDGTGILQIATVTPSGKSVNVDEDHMYMGEDCNSLVDVIATHSTPNHQLSEESDTYGLDSSDFLGLYGPNLGCFEIVEIESNGKRVSTGPVVITWDAAAGKYTAANPSKVTMRF